MQLTDVGAKARQVERDLEDFLKQHDEDTKLPLWSEPKDTHHIFVGRRMKSEDDLESKVW